MYIRNEADRGLGIVKDEAAIADLTHTPPTVRWLFKCVLKVIHLLEGATTQAVREQALDQLKDLLSENPGIIEQAVTCDDSNNPASVVANCQTILTVYLLLDFNRGEFVYSFSTKEFQNVHSQ